jgi:uncharacterized protein
MKFTLDARSDVNLIRGYGAGEVRVGQHVVKNHCIVTADALITDWSAPDPSMLSPADLATILELKPEVVLLGTGPTQRFPSASVRAEFAQRGIGLETMDLGAACRTYNILVQEERRVVAVLYVS